MTIKKVLVIMAGSLLLSACTTYETYKPYVYGTHGLIHEKPPQYQLAGETRTLILPPQLSSEKISSFYEVPSIPARPVLKKLSLSPPGSVAEKLESKPSSTSMTNNSAGASEPPIHTDQEGVVVFVLSQPLSQAWLTVGQALPKAGFRVIKSKPEQHLYYLLDGAGTQPGINLLTLEVATVSDSRVKIWFHAPLNRALTRPEAGVMLERLQRVIS